MSDPIAQKVIEIIHGAVLSGGYRDADFIEDRVKEIRQQIGRELLEGKCYLAGTEYVDADYINEVCQLEEDNES